MSEKPWALRVIDRVIDAVLAATGTTLPPQTRDRVIADAIDQADAHILLDPTIN